MNSVRLGVVWFLVLFAQTRAAQSFDAWADDFAARWARLSPEFTTRAQYFSGAEQDELDRQLSMFGTWNDVFGRKAMLQRAALARQGQEELKGGRATPQALPFTFWIRR